MLKRSITYETFDGETVTEEFYFNMTKPELMEMASQGAESFQELTKKVIETQDRAQMIEQFKAFILMSYGEKSEDGRRFVKSEEISKAFTQTAAYPVLFMELATDADSAVAFITGIMPQDMLPELQKALDEAQKPQSPLPPTTP